MTFQFCCPQGHVLQGDPSQIGQVLQCPVCGSNFVVPPVESMQPQGQPGFLHGPPGWPQQPGYGMPNFPAQSGMPGMALPQGSPLPSMQPGSLPTAQPLSSVAPQLAAPDAGEAEGRPRFVLDFDPHVKAALPFDIPGQGGADAPHNAPPPFMAGPLPVPSFSMADQAAWSDPTPAVEEEAADEEEKPKQLHIRCPSGHVVKATSDLLGKQGRCPACKKTFELRFEDSLEFQRKKDKLLRKAMNKEGQTWLAWALLAAVLVVVGLIALVFVVNH